jgi:hypothetical protein
MYSIIGFSGLQKDTHRVITPTGSILFPPKDNGSVIIPTTFCHILFS